VDDCRLRMSQWMAERCGERVSDSRTRCDSDSDSARHTSARFARSCIFDPCSKPRARLRMRRLDG
jgi:hypothetical protein